MEKIVKGEIIHLSRIIDENEMIRGYQAVVEFKEKPSLKLGEITLKW